ncbi:phage shock protein C (PspC) family protein [Caloranaerobacter azorensis DSM 13643]|uniref:Phage shock protein C (PspC) family protein n=1 Tax=Caloranaerobacter azorensis DSM 13643 TaxID=1121264 RepID=A0A1M5SG69_9FIRM|nr:PspC domain-containing protein [Caloranaerobacter azorensis]SHH37420.1 phage shock protein C (PspC) family protein [Caloranaerobacter azorensis DSM 13643]
MQQKLYRSTNDRMIAGVCGGIAEYFNIDSTLVRLLWLILGFTMGIGFLAYIICIIVIPESPVFSNGYSYNNQNNTDRNRILAGLILILLGIIFLLKKTLYWIDFEKLWPIFLIIAGIYIIYGKKVRD